MGEDHPEVWKLSLSTALSQATKKVKHKLPPQYAKYTKVFDKPKDGKLLLRFFSLIDLFSWLFILIVYLLGEEVFIF